MPCERKTVLLEAYQSAAKFYSFAVDQLKNVRATASKTAYEDAMRLSDEARSNCGVARSVLEEHTTKHGC
jgi:hypothetical protein